MSQLRWNNVDQLSFVGTNFEELSSLLSPYSHNNGLSGEQGEGREIHMFDLAALSIIASSYEGDFTISFPSPADTNLVLIPLAGSAVATVGNREMLSAGSHGIIADGMLENQTRIIGPRKHLCISPIAN